MARIRWLPWLGGAMANVLREWLFVEVNDFACVVVGDLLVVPIIVAVDDLFALDELSPGN